MALTREQRTHIEKRIDQVVRDQLYGKPDPKPPAHVARAQATIATWAKECDNARKAHRKTIEVAAQRVRETVLFGEPGDALKAVQAFESAKFK